MPCRQLSAEQQEVDDPDFREVVENRPAAKLLHFANQRRIPRSTAFLTTNSLPRLCGTKLSQARRTRRPERPRGAVTGGRVKIGYQAGIKLLRSGAQTDRHHPVPAGFTRHGMLGNLTLPNVGTSPRNLRVGPAAHSFHRGVLPSLAEPLAIDWILSLATLAQTVAASTGFLTST